MMDQGTYQNPPELFVLKSVALIEEKCLVGYVVSVAVRAVVPLSLFLLLCNSSALSLFFRKE